MRSAALALLAGALVACQEPLRVPYIPPELANWPETYRGVPGLRLHAFEAGRLHLHRLLGGSRSGSGEGLPVLAFLLEHPRQGLVLIDTGLSPRVTAEPDVYPGGLRRMLLDPSLDEGLSLADQLRRSGFPTKIGTVILTNCRFPHAGGLSAFPDAVVVTSRAEHRAAMADGWLSTYVADDFSGVRTWRLIDLPGGEPLGTFPSHVDLFEDGSVILLDTAGVTAGGLAVLLRLPRGPVIIAGDVAEQASKLRTTSAPFLLADRRRWWESLWRLKRFAELAEGLRVIPAHDTKLLAAVPGLQYHEPRPPTPTAENRASADRAADHAD